jgi:exopolysaccharide production protein ExoQ
MPPFLALFLGLSLAGFMFWRDRDRRQQLSLALTIPLLWYLTCATRPLGVWLNLWGVPLGGGSGEDAAFVDRYYYLLLTLIGLAILSSRRFSWGGTIARSPWLLALLAFMALSITWSNYPYISFKRYIKVLGAATMALVVLTERNPGASFLALLRYVLYLHVPLSIICNKYFRGMSVQFSWDGSGQLWQGLATSKNTLGQVAMLAFVYFLWEVWRDWQKRGWRNPNLGYVFMSVWLLKGSDDGVSMTAIVVCIFASFSFVQFRRRLLQERPIRPFGRLVLTSTLGLALVVYLHGIFLFDADSLFGKLITTFGRDITMTDRTHIWGGMYDVARGSFFGGIGFGGFWIGREANIAWNATMTWALGQGHSGYVDTFLQTGTIGLVLILGVIISTFRKLIGSAADDVDYLAFRLTLLLTIVFINITETTFLRGDHHLWFHFMLACWSTALPVPPPGESGSVAAIDPATSAEENDPADGAADPTRI